MPANAIAIDVQVVGGEGGNGGSASRDEPPGIPGGQGALGQIARARIAVTPGEQVAVLVGGGGDGGQSVATPYGAGRGGHGGGGGNLATNALVGGGGRGDFDRGRSLGGKGGTVGGSDGQDGYYSFNLFGDISAGAGGGGGGGRGGSGGGGGAAQSDFSRYNDYEGASGGGGGGGGGSSYVSIGGTRLRVAGGSGGGGGSTSRVVNDVNNTPGTNAAQPSQDDFHEEVAACATSDGGQAGIGGQTSYYINTNDILIGAGGGGGGGGGGGYHGGSGGDAGWSGNRVSSPSPAGAGGRAQGCSSSAAPHTLTGFGLTVGVDEQGTLEEDRPAGSGRAGKVVITPVFAQAATHAITVTASPPEGGSVACDPNPVNAGATATCTATPTAGWHLSGISGCNGTAGTASPYTTGAITDACTVTATFARDGATPGASAHVTAVPTLGEWALMLTGLLAAGLGLRRLRRG